jgi:hypothetical protein
MITLHCKFCMTGFYALNTDTGLSALAAAYLFHVTRRHFEKLADLATRPEDIDRMLSMLPVRITS